MVFAATRRIVFKPARYEVPAKSARPTRPTPSFLLALIATLMASEGLIEASKAALQTHHGLPVEFLAVFSLPWLMNHALTSTSPATLWNLYRGAYLVDVLTFYFLLCYRPFGIQFHVETSLFNVLLREVGSGHGQAGQVGPDPGRAGQREVGRREDV